MRLAIALLVAVVVLAFLLVWVLRREPVAAANGRVGSIQLALGATLRVSSPHMANRLTASRIQGASF
jgi:hypothetical protein